jgi:uncharacterized delta-60 repeat protein
MTKWLAIAVSVVSVCAVVAFAIYTYSGNDDAPEAGAGVEKTEPAEPPTDTDMEQAVPLGDPGDLDTTFGTGGKVTTHIGAGNDYGGAVVRAVVVDAQGRIVVVGQETVDGDYGGAVARYTPSGKLDTSFSSNGIAVTPLDETWGVAVDSTGRIVVAGSSYRVGHDDFAVVRYTSAGVLDTTFGTGGIVTTDIGSGTEAGYGVVVDSQGRIVVAGESQNDSDNDFAVVRYTSAGDLDTTFGTGGKVTTAIGDGSDIGFGVAVDSQGRVVVAGYSRNGSQQSDTDFAVVRYTSAGELDTSFSTDGKLTTDIGTVDELGHAMGVDSQGRVVVAGYSENGTDVDFAVVRYTSAGELDTSFGGGDGIVTTDFGAGEDSGHAVAIDSQDRVVVAGTSYKGGSSDFAVVRYVGGP